MKGSYALHEGKYKKILDIKDSGKLANVPGGGNHYYLEGVKKPVHQSKLKDIKLPSEMDKMDRIETTADGKTEIDVGSEPLDKLSERWKKLKKSLDSDKAIMSIADQEYHPEPDDEQQQPQEGQEAPQGQEAQQASDQEQQPQDGGGQSAEEGGEQANGDDAAANEQMIIQALKDEGYDDAEIDHIIHGSILPEATVDDHKAKNEKAEGEINQQNMVEDSKLEREHKKKMQELEYKKAESELADPEAEKSHRKRMMDIEHEMQKKKTDKESLEIEHRKKLQELELAAKKKEMDKKDPAEDMRAQEAAMQLEHKKRMMDLEYEKAKKEADKQDPTENMRAKQLEFELNMKRMEKELELEFKKKELALKLKITEEAAKQKAEHAAMQAEEDAKVNAAVKKEQSKHKIADAKKPPAKEPNNER